MKYIVFLILSTILLSPISTLKAGDLGNYISYESDTKVVKFQCENGILAVIPILDDIFKITLYPGSIIVPESSFVVLHESFDPVGFELSEDDEKFTLTSSSIRLLAYKTPFRLQFEEVSGTVLLSENNADGVGWENDSKYARFDISSGEPNERLYTFNLHTIESEPDSVDANGELLSRAASLADLDSLSEGWWHDGAVLILKRSIQPSEQITFSAHGVSIGTSIRQQKPRSFSAKQNYPNPFNISTTFPFTMQNGGEARVFIYNVRGEQVRFLRSAWTAPGDYFMYWDGRDSYGKVLPSGVYIFRLVTQWEQYSKKIVLLK